MSNCACLGAHTGDCKDSTASFPKGVEFYTAFEFQAKECLGEVLTIIDATLTDERQNKAMKDVIRKSFHQMLGKAQGYCSKADIVDGATWGQSVELSKL